MTQLDQTMFERIMEITVFAYQQNAHKKYLWDKDKRLRHYTTDDLEILIATMDRETLSFLETIFSKPVGSIRENVLLINQSKSKTLTSGFKNIRVINDINYGLSRSRNLAIKESKCDLLWLLDDDCVISKGAVTTIVAAHSEYEAPIITFQTTGPDGKLVRNYEAELNSFSRKRVEKVLSPEITLKRSPVLGNELIYDLRFGLGGQFEDSENYIFLLDALDKKLEMFFIPETIVSHNALSSSDDYASNRIIYARGALSRKLKFSTALFDQCKYALFLLRKGQIKNWNDLVKKYRLFGFGMEDYDTGFEGHRNHRPDL
jgi:glycosyltransferase involved in cell wall biosynthesis